MKKQKFGIGMKALAFVMAAVGLAGTGQSQFIQSSAYNVRQVKTNDAVNQQHQAPKPVSVKKDFSGGDNPYKHYRKGVRNQRQYRAWLRSVPQFRNSKKNRLA